MKREQMFVQMLEGLHKDGGSLYSKGQNRLHRVYKGLSDAVVKEGLGLE